MPDRPILFSAPMVRALLDGRKTQTRRIIAFPGISGVMDFVHVGTDTKTGRRVYEMKDGCGAHVSVPAGKHCVTCRYMPRFTVGDRLYVRETFSGDWQFSDLPPSEWSKTLPIWFWADGDPVDGDWTKPKPGIHMPRWASRLTLIVTDVRVQRLQEISEADALAEGIHVQRLAEWAAQGIYVGEGNKPILMAADDPAVTYMTTADADCTWGTAREAFVDLWDGINAARGFGWDANPWICAVSFAVERRNIDQVAARIPASLPKLRREAGDASHT